MFRKIKDLIYLIRHGYERKDCWSLDYFLSDKFTEMILHMRKNKMGCPGDITFNDIKDFPIDFIEHAMDFIQEEYEEMKDKNEYDPPDLFDEFTIWSIVLFRIVYCLKRTHEEKFYNEYSEEYFKQVFGEDGFVFEDYDNKTGLYRLITNEPDKDLKEKYDKRQDEIESECKRNKNEAFELLSKWYYSLWD